MAADTLAPDHARWKSPGLAGGPKKRGPFVQALRKLVDAKSDDGARKQHERNRDRFFRDCQLLLLKGQDETLIGYQARLLDILSSKGSVPTLRTAMRTEGAAGRLQDDASERLIHAIATGGPEELGPIEHRTRAQIAELYQVLIAIRRRKAVLG